MDPNQSSRLTVRELQQDDISGVVNYWLHSAPEYLQSLGVDMAKLPDESSFRQMLASQITAPYSEKRSYCLVWMINGQPAGHSNVNPIRFGEDAFMHLHLWNPD